MAKLNGVKTLDMVNGEITKISYDGAEYAKVADRAEKDDLLLSEFDELDIDEGAFYACHSAYRHGIHLYDNNGDFRDRNHGEFKVFRKISASTSPTIEKRVDDLESRVTAIEGVKAETIEFEGAQYRKVERDAREGDVVILRDTGGDVFEVGKTYKVEKDVQIADKHDYLYDVYRRHLRRTHETVDVYEPIEESVTTAEIKAESIPIKPKPTAPALKVGDFVKFTKYGGYEPLDITLNKPYELFVDYDGELMFLDDVQDERNAPLEHMDCYEILSADEAKWAKLGRKVNEYKVGDIIGITVDQCGLEVGAISKVTKVHDYGVNYNGIGCIYGADYGYFKLVAPVEATL